MNDQRDTTGPEPALINLKPFLDQPGQLAVYAGDINAPFFKQPSIRYYPGFSAATAIALPVVGLKPGLSVNLLQCCTNLILQTVYIIFERFFG